MEAYIIKIENLPTFSGKKTDKLIGFGVVDLLRNHLQIRPPQDVDVLAVLERPGNFLELTSSDVLIPLLVLAVLVRNNLEIARPRTSSPPSWSLSWPSSSKISQKLWSSDVLVPVPDLIMDVLVPVRDET